MVFSFINYFLLKEQAKFLSVLEERHIQAHSVHLPLLGQVQCKPFSRPVPEVQDYDILAIVRNLVTLVELASKPMVQATYPQLLAGFFSQYFIHSWGVRMALWLTLAALVLARTFFAQRARKPPPPPSRDTVRPGQKVAPPAQKAEKVAPPAQKAEKDHASTKDSASPAQKAEKVAPPAEKAEVVAPPAQKAEVVPPPAQKAEMVAPPAQKAKMVAPPAQKAEKVAPPAQKAEKVAPPAQKAEKDHASTKDSASPAQKAEKVAPPAQKTEMVAPPAQKAESVAPPAQKAEMDGQQSQKAEMVDPSAQKAEMVVPTAQEAEMVAPPAKEECPPNVRFDVPLLLPPPNYEYPPPVPFWYYIPPPPKRFDVPPPPLLYFPPSPAWVQNTPASPPLVRRTDVWVEWLEMFADKQSKLDWETLAKQHDLKVTIAYPALHYIVISGDRETVTKACRKIKGVIDLSQTTNVDLLSVACSTRYEDRPSRIWPSGHVLKVLNIDPNQHGIVVGKGGNIVDALRKKHGVDIYVPHRDESYKAIHILGPEKEAVKAKRSIQKHIKSVLTPHGWVPQHQYMNCSRHVGGNSSGHD
ncbi:uncharacterized protein [Panulirus ornatus]|uniref:uncharacterized protein isoform X2 n=1 Tax=Panulirus ornatus TaxID=150431 RepID=UPI003A8C6D42